ncbi:hypothetical protein E2C01_065014 [Portunus trituberculatus]|uniref:Uncharacterized protein n=1 Tax=Portunus trituberculatus TaxID=210409 RepID=A0A5B7HNH2_PORTR|nr:hypothetical protein [Portunus trituberculatus]
MGGGAAFHRVNRRIRRPAARDQPTLGHGGRFFVDRPTRPQAPGLLPQLALPS